MPYRRTIIRKRSVRRPKTKQVTRRRRLTYIPIGLRNKLLTRMRYYSEFYLDPNGRPTVAAKEFRTSCYDIDISVGGQQPTPFDELCTFYKRFRVLGAKVVMRPLRYNFADGNLDQIYGIIIQPTVGLTTTMTSQDLMQSERVTHNYKISTYTGRTGPYNGAVMMKYSAKKFYGPVAKYDDDFTCTAAADAARYAVISCFAYAADPTGGAATDTMYYSVWIELIVHCTEPEMMLAS